MGMIYRENTSPVKGVVAKIKALWEGFKNPEGTM